MKKLLTNGLSLAIALTYSSFLVGCGGGGNPKKNVDVQGLMGKLNETDTDKLTVTLAELSAAGPDALPALDKMIELLDNKDPEVRRLASYVIYVMGESAKKALPKIKELAKTDRNANARLQHMNTWNAIDPDSAPKLQQQPR